jgi:hypothetical protein
MHAHADLQQRRAFGGALGFGGELLAGGGVIDALVTGLSTAGLAGLGPTLGTQRDNRDDLAAEEARQLPLGADPSSAHGRGGLSPAAEPSVRDLTVTRSTPMHAYANLSRQPAGGRAAVHSGGPRASAIARRARANDATDVLARALDGSPSVLATRRLQRGLDGAGPARVQRTGGPAVIRRVDDEFAGAELERYRGIAARMGIDGRTLSFRRSGTDQSRTVGNIVYVNTTMSEEETEFILGHELSHYITRDVRGPVPTIPLSMLLAGVGGTLLGGPWSSLAGGLLGFGGEWMAGGGFINSAITGLSMAGMIGLGPLGYALGGSVGGILGTLAGAGLSLPMISKLFEIKSDLHSGSVFGGRGGISRFRGQIRDNEDGDNLPPTTGGNSLIEPTHPPLTMRIGYLERLFGNTRR